AECGEGLACAPNLGACPAGCEDTCDLNALAPGFCVPAGGGADGAACSRDLDCASGLYCRRFGLGGTCAPGGSGDLGADCTTTADCFPGLWCSVPMGDPPAQTCQPPLLSFVPFEGAECPKDTGAFRAYFEVATQNDFYRLPFPNDAAVGKDGRIDFSGHPSPGVGPLGVDIVRAYADALGEDFDGFSPLPVALFRFSGDIDFATLDRGDTTSPVRLVDVTPGAAEFGDGTGLAWGATNSAGNFICAHVVSITPSKSLLPGHTYAAILTTDVKSADGVAAARDADFEAMLAAAAPPSARLTRAHTAYAPLRAWLASTTEIAASQLAVAAVFTVQPTTEVVRRLGEVIRASGPTPALTVVAAGDPCACTATPGATFEQICGKITLPVVQAGARPYLTPDDGGAIAFGPGGDPILQSEEQACFALTVPLGAVSPMPVTIYAHGTGGTFESGVADLGTALSTRGIATFSFTGVMHGERRGVTDLGPDLLFFNLMNPRAARDNVLQGAADVFQIVRTLRTQAVTTAAGAVTFDATRIYFFGHSQGSTSGGLAVPYEPGIAVAVLSGAGGYLTKTLRAKTSPFDVRSTLEFVLGESVGAGHPVLALLQTFFDRSDLVHYGPLYFRSPAAGMPPRHVLMTYGLGDTYSPPDALCAFARSLGVKPVDSLLVDCDLTGDGETALVPPVVTPNYTGSEPDVMALLAHVDPMGVYDGHLVAFQDADLATRWASFLESAALTGVPTLP
ncbi:MAG: hypothetical protein AABZ30_10695, partial [Myxococcota bacterium]